MNILHESHRDLCLTRTLRCNFRISKISRVLHAVMPLQILVNVTSQMVSRRIGFVSSLSIFFLIIV